MLDVALLTLYGLKGANDEYGKQSFITLLLIREVMSGGDDDEGGGERRGKG